jgi:PAS domain S-box-containing protein
VGSGYVDPKNLVERSSGSDIPIEERYRFLVDAVRDYAIFMLSPTGTVATWNNGAHNIKGYLESEIVGRHFSVFYPPEDIAAGKPDAELATAISQGRIEDEGWRVRKDGSMFWANVVITAVYDSTGALRGFAKVTRDMTERRRLTELERASELAARIQETREDEQRRVARELHDDLGQQLTALKMAVVLHEGHLNSNGDSLQSLAQTRELQDQIDAMAASLRRIAADLRPPMLDDLGLGAALEWLTEDFARRYGLRVTSRLEVHHIEFSDGAATAIFRMVQEALNNVVRHAQATAVDVEMVCTRDTCTIRVEDNGKGIARDAPRKKQSFGLLGMRERARQLEGSVSIESSPGQGFHLVISLPRSKVAVATGMPD